MKRFIKGQRGMSMVEILVSMMIMGLLTIAVLPGITFGIIQINESAQKTKTVYSLQSTIDKDIARVSAAEGSSLSISFGSTSITVSGTVLEDEQAYGTQGHKVKIKAFVPVN